MRLTPIIILLAVLQLNARDSRGQKLTYSKDNTTISQVFKEIKRQTGYNVVWYEGKLNSQMSIDANFYNTPLDKVMDNVLFGRAVTYKIIGKAIVVKADASSFRDKLIGLFANIDVHGRVLDENDKPLVGAVVKIKGGATATSTDSNGEFLLKNVDDKTILVITFLGYETQEVKASKNIVAIKLVPSTDKLDEVQINAGYYTVTDRERTGSIAKITSKNIETQPVNNVLQAMQANIPGVQIIQNTGIPGGGFSVQIRGKNSISQGNDPFYIIDGVPFTATSIEGSRGAIFTKGASPLASINPNDIESIEVLKDADATAIYGSRGANGVILITTKKGIAGKTRTSLSASYGISRVGKKMDFMNTDEYLSMRNEALTNDKLSVSATDYDLNGTWDKNRYTNWQDELIGRAAPMANIQASLSGGTNSITYLIGGNYYKEKTVFPGENSYRRNSGNFSLQYTSDNKKLNASLGANYSQINSNLISTDLTQFIALAPNYPALLDNRGLLNWENNTIYENPMAYTQRPYKTKTTNLVSNAAINYTVVTDLKIKVSIGYNVMGRTEFSSDPLNTFSPVYNYGTDKRRSFFANNTTDSWIVEAQTAWSKKIGPGILNVLIGTTFQEGRTESQGIRGSGYASDALMENLGSASVFTIDASSNALYHYTAAYGRLNYILKDKYLLNLTGRRDGSSRFGNDNQFANFGALGVAWIISEENFIKEKLPFITFAKLRGSYGTSGNDRIADYGYLDLWNPRSTYQGISTMAPLTIKNPNYAWELNKKAEVAIELSFLKNRINLSINRYSNRSSNQLLSKQLAPSTGFTSLTFNLPAKVENTGWEFELNTKNISGKSFSWTTAFNLTIPKNKLVAYPNLATSADATKYEIGKPLSIKKLYKTSVDPKTGFYIAEDHDKNGVIDFDKDLYVIDFVGRKFYGGLQNSFSYKNVHLDLLFQFVKQTGPSEFTGLNMPGSFDASTPISNQLGVLADHWKSPDDLSRFQKYTTLGSGATPYLSATSYGSNAISDNSFVKLKNIFISYDLPSAFLQKLKLANAKFFLQGQNIFTITKYKGLDPETQSLTSLPPLQVFTAGIQLTL